MYQVFLGVLTTVWVVGAAITLGSWALASHLTDYREEDFNVFDEQ